MELKQGTFDSIHQYVYCFNRTFMELKLEKVGIWYIRSKEF